MTEHHAEPAHGEQRRRRPATWWALAVAGASLCLVVGWSGSPGLQVGRSLVVAGLTVGALRWSEHRATGVGGGLALAVGLPATVAGIGIGVGWAARGTASVVTAAGIALLGAGLVLLGHALRRLWVRTPGWWRLLTVPLAVLGVVVVGLPTVVAVMATNVPPLPSGPRTPADVGLTAQDVTMTATDGTPLAGWWVPSTNGAAVVLRHGAGSTRDDVLDHAAVLAGAGYGVLLTDARGHGASGGDAMDLGWWGDDDVAAAVTLVRTLPGVDERRVAVVGLSMGGEEAIGALAGSTGIAAVVAEGATGRVPEDKGWLPGGVTGWLQHRMDRLQATTADLLSAASPPTPLPDAVRAAEGRPVLLIAAGGEPDEVRAAELLAEAGGERVEVWVVPGSDHTGGLRTDPDAWRARVVGFLDAAIGPASIG